MSNVIWLTGISGSGKTTLGLMLQKELKKKCDTVEFLDGDIVRDFFKNDLGFTRKERILNVKRIAFTAHMLAKNGICTIVANIAPYFEVRDFIRQNVHNYIQIFLNASIDTVRKRDVKGYYKKFDEGKIKNIVGLDDPYDKPRNPHVKVNVNELTEEESLKEIIDYLNEKGIF